jgi:hypothetical protein
MRKKNGVNIMLFVIIIILIGILSRSKSPKNQTAGILLQTDRDFSELSLPIFPCLAREAKIPNTDSIEKITKPVLIAEISPG